jgi:hypothetical protein
LVKSRIKGNKIRRSALAYYQKQGYVCDVSEKTGRFVKVKDLLGIADIVAIRKDEVLFIQCAANSHIHSHKVYCAWAKEFCGDHIRFQQFIWVDRIGEKIYEYYGNGDYEVI